VTWNNVDSLVEIILMEMADAKLTDQEEDKKSVSAIKEILLDVWEGGNEADIQPLMSVLTSTNCNYQTEKKLRTHS
jgi:hypothetical protein